MANLIKIFGIEPLKVRLKRLRKDMHQRLGNGLIAGGLLLQRYSQEQVPVDTSSLKNSAFTRSIKKGSSLPLPDASETDTQEKGMAAARRMSKTGNYGEDTEVYVGFTQNYAIYVHENLGSRHRVGNAKFLEKPAREHADEIKLMIINVARNGHVG